MFSQYSTSQLFVPIFLLFPNYSYHPGYQDAIEISATSVFYNHPDIPDINITNQKPIRAHFKRMIGLGFGMRSVMPNEAEYWSMGSMFFCELVSVQDIQKYIKEF
jgi:hypothetical protein